MKKNKKILKNLIVSFALILTLLVFCDRVNAQETNTINKSIAANASEYILNDFTNEPTYIRIVIAANKSNASYKLSVIGYINNYVYSGPYTVKSLSKTFSGTTQNIIYVLPRSGMSCPSDATYCVGAGTNLTGTKVIQGNECNGSACDLLGLKITNTSSSSISVTGSVYYSN